MAKKKKKNQVEIGRWVFLVVLTLFTIWYFKADVDLLGLFRGEGLSSGQLKDPRQALQLYAAQAQAVLRTNDRESIEPVLDDYFTYVAPKDKIWFEKSYKDQHKRFIDRPATEEDKKIQLLKRIITNQGLTGPGFSIIEQQSKVQGETATFALSVTGRREPAVVEMIQDDRKRWRYTGIKEYCY